MAFLDFLLGKKEKTKQFQTFTPQQQGILNQLLSLGSQSLPQQSQYFESLLQPGSEAEGAFAAPAQRQFQEEIIPSIAERFTGQFGTGSSRSSAFGQQLGQAGAGLAERLAAMRAQLAGQGAAGLQGLLSTGLSPQFSTAFRPAAPGFLGSLLSGVAPAAGQAALGFGFGGRQGALSALGGGR